MRTLHEIIFLFLISSALLAHAPAKPGVQPSERIQEMHPLFEATYTEGGVAKRMAHFRTAREQGIRDEVSMSFPVLMGYYADDTGPEWMVESLQEELFDGPWPTPTMAEHYEEMSYGQFHLSGTVYGWYELSENGVYYEGSQTPPYDNGFIGPPGGVADFLRETLILADSTVDFSQYDSDGPDGIPNSGDDDGYVDAAFFVHSGPGGEGGGPYIWSHRWVYRGMWGSAFVTNDSAANGGLIRVDDYIMQPANGTTGGLIQIGVFSHEFGHALGLPDLYDTDYSSGGVGDWCLMAGGSWNTPSSPSHLSVWCKEMLGWITPVIPDDNILDFEIPAIEEEPFALKLWTHGDVGSYIGSYSQGQDVGREYFLIENRQRLGTDVHLDNEGLLIWHVDNSLWTNSDENHRMVDIRGADDNGNIGTASVRDPWPGPTNAQFFDFETTPAAINWAGENTETALRNITAGDTSIYADVEIYETVPHLSLATLEIFDGDGDQIMGGGETGEVWVEVTNSGGPATNLTAQLIDTSGVITLVNDLITFPNVGFMETVLSTQAFEFIIDDEVEPQILTLSFVFEAPEMMESDTFSFSFGVGDPEVGLIDADGVLNGVGDYQDYYKEALTNADRVFVTWDMVEDGIPSDNWLAGSQMIIWFTGDVEEPLAQWTVDLLEGFLDGGGRLLISGQDVTNGGGEPETFVADYLAAQRVSEPTRQVYVYGNEDHDIMTVEDRYLIRSSSAALNQDSPDKLNLLEHGEALFVDPLDGNIPLGTTVSNGIYRAIFMGFGFEAVAPLDGDPELARADLMDRMLDWLAMPVVAVDDEGLQAPASPHIQAAYPNPFNPMVQLEVLGIDAAQIVIHDLQGREVTRLAVPADGLVSWTPGPRLAGGLYFARLHLDGKPAGDLVKITYLK